MTPVEQAKAELDRALAAIPAPHGVTATRAHAAATQALADFESNVCLLTWERTRVERVAKQRAERAEVERRAEDAYAAAAAKIERKKARSK
jgi:hypothetical protein